MEASSSICFFLNYESGDFLADDIGGTPKRMGRELQLRQRTLANEKKKRRCFFLRVVFDSKFREADASPSNSLRD